MGQMGPVGLALLISVVGSALAFGDEPVFGVPMKPDPAFAIDGDLGDWAEVPNALRIEKPEQVVWGPGTWTSAQDLSGTVHVAWRQEHLYMAADVTDDMLRQSQRGGSIWKGDHIELYLDVQPDLESERTSFGEGQFHLALSPGNFGTNPDPLMNCAPEAYCYVPKAGPVAGAIVAAAQTSTGYAIEAAIPWEALGVKPVQGMELRLEVGLSDTDSPEPQQEALMTVLTTKWEHSRKRLMPACLAGTDGVASVQAKGTEILKETALERGVKETLTFVAPAVPEGRIGVLTMKARLQFEQVAGYASSLRLTVNGKVIEAGRLINKPIRVKSRNGAIYTMAGGELFSTFYAPDFTSADSHPHYGLLDGVKACEFEMNVTDLLKEGENSLILEHAGNVDNVLHVADLEFGFRVPPPPPKPKARPPTGPLDTIEPLSPLKTEYSVQESPDAKLEVRVGGDVFVVESQFSSPEPAWVHGSCSFFKHERTLEPRDEVIVVRDTFTNLTGENLGVMHRHQVPLGDRMKKLWIAGLEQAGTSGSSNAPSNPTSFAATGGSGIGLIALDDVSHVHVASYALDGTIGIADNNLVLRPNASYTVEWAVIPTSGPDYWAFINAARRLVGANFLIDGGFAFFRAGPLTDAWTDEQTADFVRFKDAKYICASIDYPLYEGRYPHGTSFQRVPHDNCITAFERRRRLVPEAKNLVYFHCFIDVLDESPERFNDARVLRPDGKQADYGQPYDRIFFPTETNSYGQEIEKNVLQILDEIRADGVYWDEHEYSRWTYHYGEPWDGCSGDIDPKTMKLTGLKSSVTLLTEPWRLRVAKYIMSKGALIGNGVPFTRAMAALKFPCFVETGSITNCADAQLYSPIALGDHLTERNELDAYNVMLAALDYGCVYHWYNDVTVIPTHHHLTRYMFPITPMELHEGYILGKERIITKKSGLFGWGDGAQHEVHVIDDTGHEVEGFNAPRVEKDGKAYTELRIAEGWSAAIVRNGELRITN